MTNASALSRLVVLLTAIVMGFLLLASSVNADAGPEPTVEYLVRPGDSLWSLAARHGDPEDDPRVMIHHIRRLNGITSSAISPGQVLLIPSG